MKLAALAARLCTPASGLALVLGAGALLLFWGIGQGLWEPHELEVAELVRQSPAGRPPLTEWAAGLGWKLLGESDWAARVPIALLGLATLAATYFLGARLASPRAGLYSALVLLSSPLFFLQARHLSSDIGVAAGSALLVLAAVGARPAGASGRGWDLLDLALAAIGALFCYTGGGALLGLAVPLAALAAAGLAARSLERGPWPRERVAALAVALGAALALFSWQAFDLREGYPGERALFGMRWVLAREYVPALGGAWGDADLEITFESLFEPIAFGFFPWSALAPVAVARLALGSVGRGTSASGRPLASHIVFAWALAAYVVAAVLARRLGPVQYPAVVAVALAVGMWAEDTEEGDPAPLWGLFALLGAAVLAKDLALFPAKLVSLHLPGQDLTYPAGMKHQLALGVLGGLFGVVLLATLSLWPRLVRRGIAAALAIGVASAAWFVLAWSPALARKLSSKELFEVHRALRREGDRLGLMGPASELRFYAGDEFEPIQNRSELASWLARPGRVFAVLPREELCPLHRERGPARFEYHVLDDENASYLLVSNRLAAGEIDRNPLARAILRQPPGPARRGASALFDGQIELLGADLPEVVKRGETFPAALHFRVREPVAYNWKVFLHFDGEGVRFQGDHEPAEGRCGSSYWQPGDYIVDTFEVKAGGWTYPRGNYQVWVGFYRGSPGNWINMPASGEGVIGDRVPLGTIEVR